MLRITKSASPSPATAGSPLTYSLLVENATTGSLSNVVVTDNVPAGTSYVNTSATCGGSQSGGVLTFALGTMVAGASQACAFQVVVDSGPGTVTFLADTMESGSTSWTATAGSGTTTWSLGTSNAHSPTHAWFAQDVSTVTDQYLAMTNPVTLSGQPVLRFWHSYTTEANYDGGVVEISVNGGAWTDLGSKITQGGYNSTISSSYGNPIGGRQAFSGSSGGYVETVANLSSYVGSSVRIRFRMATDTSVGSTGWYVDDVEIVDEDTVSNTACVSADGGNNDCDTVVTAVLPGTNPTPTPETPTPTPVTPTPETPTPTATPTNRDVIYVSSSTNGTAVNTGAIPGSVAFEDEDILSYDRATGVWSMVFDGSNVGVTVDLNAFDRLSDGSFLMSFDIAATIPTLGTVDDSDIVRFVPTSLGANTAGSLSWYFDGSDVGLSTTNENNFGAWSPLANGPVYLSTLGAFSVAGVSGDGADIFICTPGSLGSTTTCTFSMYWDGSANGFAGEVVDDLFVVLSTP